MMSRPRQPSNAEGLRFVRSRETERYCLAVHLDISEANNHLHTTLHLAMSLGGGSTAISGYRRALVPLGPVERVVERLGLTL